MDILTMCFVILMFKIVFKLNNKIIIIIFDKQFLKTFYKKTKSSFGWLNGSCFLKIKFSILIINSIYIILI